MDAQSLRLLIRQKLVDGRLPHDSMPRIWGGPGAGETCDACAEIVGTSQWVMEGISLASERTPVQFHVECFYIWDAERKPPRAG